MFQNSRSWSSLVFAAAIRIAKTLLFLFILNHTTAAKNKPVQSHQLLYFIKTPQQLVYPLMPNRYSAKIILKGELALQMLQAIKNLGLPSPQFIEIFDKKKGFNLGLLNEEYPDHTKSLLCGILNPVEMIEIVLSSLLRYKSPEQLSLLVEQTNIRIVDSLYDSRPVHYVKLTPIGSRFGYTCRDFGPFMHESWLTELNLVIDSLWHIVYQLSAVRSSIIHGEGEFGRKGVITNHYLYTFNYHVIQGNPVPTDLTLLIDNSEVLSISATYKLSGNLLLFNSRKICYNRADSNNQCLIMNYEDFEYGKIAEKRLLSKPVSKYANEVKKAAVLSQKAAGCFRKGDILSAVHFLSKILENYPATPQAVEARKLLLGLPQGL